MHTGCLELVLLRCVANDKSPHLLYANVSRVKSASINMPALTAIVDKTVSGDKNILLYYNTSTAKLVYIVKSGTEEDDSASDIKTAGNDDYGYILNPSQMGGLNWKGTNYVTALTTPVADMDHAPDEYRVCTLLPQYKELTTTTRDNQAVAMCTDGETCWAYYMRAQSKGSRTRSLNEINLVTGASKQCVGTTDAWIDCSIAAWYDTEQKQVFVIYEGSGLVEYDTVRQQIAFLPGTGNMMRNTPLALSYYNNTVYLYYSGRNGGDVQRVVKTGTTWGPAATVTGSVPLAQDCQLTVVPANGFNHLFYVSRDMSQDTADAGPSSPSYFTHIRDPLN
ncbi:hypothetical protein CDD81_5962 [Ophiocordyceps australis]|uniref:Fucose-specific lectin n=1 Tax=Ophiocordyceps australis TaxID=1399860 RepID=A0A2C5YH83_9HYPO|nr:hypothetical protein CDD81_5962 [Ophiocordyceps australis]